jgi:dTMP kinase
MLDGAVTWSGDSWLSQCNRGEVGAVTDAGAVTTRAALVSFAGLDGAGKTTQARLLADWLTATGFTVALEAPQGPSFVRSVLTDLASGLGLHDHHEVFGPDVTYLLTAFMRHRDWAERVVPALRTHQWIVTDRSAVCYYAAAYATGATNVERLRMVMRRLPVPDLVLFLDVTPEEAFRRLERRNDGREEAAFLAANERGYHQLPEFAGFTVIAGFGSIPEVHARIRQAVSQRFPELLVTTGKDRTSRPSPH